MNSKTNWLERRTLLKNLKNQDYTIANVYYGVTVGGVEVSGGGYARLALTAANWSEPADDGAGGMESHYTVELVLAKATAAWGLVDGFILVDAAVGGNVFYQDLLSTPTQININNQFRVEANDLVAHEA